MKKWSVFLLAALLTFICFGCAAADETAANAAEPAAETETVSAQSETDPATESEDAAQPEESDENEEAEPTSTPSPEPVPSPEPEIEDTYRIGETADGVFKSEWMNLQFTLPDGFSLADEDTLVSLSVFDSLLTDRNTARIAYELKAADKLGFPTMTVAVERLAEETTDTVTYEKALRESLSQQETPYVLPESTETYEIGGQSFTKLACSTVIEDTENLQDYYLLMKENRMIVITVTYTADTADKMETLLSAFSELQD